MSAEPDPHPFFLTLLTNDPSWAAAGEQAGVQRIGVDIERIGKAERQGGLPGARISDHLLEDLRALAPAVSQSRLFARLNRPYAGTDDEIEAALSYGAQSIMLPGFRRPEEAFAFAQRIRGRAEAILLVETAEAVHCLPEIVRVPEIGEVMVGLNDLHLELHYASSMELAFSATLDCIAEIVHAAGVRFGLGGVAHPGVKGLPVSPDCLLARYVALGSRSAWISQSFFKGGLSQEKFGPAIRALRARIRYWNGLGKDELCEAQALLREEAGV